MKRPFWQSAFALCFLPPVMLFGLLRVMPHAPHDGIRVVMAGNGLLTPALVARGVDVLPSLELAAAMDGVDAHTWRHKGQLLAGKHILYKMDVGPDTSSAGNVERQVLRQDQGVFADGYKWWGAFHLDEVPAGWGEVAWVWETELVRTSHSFLNPYTVQSHAAGRIVVRRAGQKLAPPVVSRNPHIRLMRIEIAPPVFDRKTDSRSYDIRLHLQVDKTITNRQLKDALLSVNYKLREFNGEWIGTAQEASFNAVSSASRRYNAAKLKDFRDPIITVHIGYHNRAFLLPRKSLLEWTLQLNDNWPLRVTMPFMDKAGHVPAVVLKPENLTFT